MADVQVKFDERQLKRIRRMLRETPGKIRRVVPAAINRTARTTRTQLSRDMRQEVNVSARHIKRSLPLSKARGDYWSAQIDISDRRIPLIGFSGARQTRKGVSYRIRKSGGRSLVESAFIQTMPQSGHKGVYKRRGPARLPIDELHGPSLAVLWQDMPALASRVHDFAGRKLQDNIDSQIARFLARKR